MSWRNSEMTRGDLTERLFDLDVAAHETNGTTVPARRVPGIYWSPAGGAERLVLLGHGGTTHKKIDYIVDMAERLAGRGF